MEAHKSTGKIAIVTETGSSGSLGTGFEAQVYRSIYSVTGRDKKRTLLYPVAIKEFRDDFRRYAELQQRLRLLPVLMESAKHAGLPTPTTYRLVTFGEGQQQIVDTVLMTNYSIPGRSFAFTDQDLRSSIGTLEMGKLYTDPFLNGRYTTEQLSALKDFTNSDAFDELQLKMEKAAIDAADRGVYIGSTDAFLFVMPDLNAKEPLEPQVILTDPSSLAQGSYDSDGKYYPSVIGHTAGFHHDKTPNKESIREKNQEIISMLFSTIRLYANSGPESLIPHPNPTLPHAQFPRRRPDTDTMSSPMGDEVGMRLWNIWEKKEEERSSIFAKSKNENPNELNDLKSLLKKHKLMPSKMITAGGRDVWLSHPYIGPGDRLAYVAYVRDGNEYRIRTFYKSKSHGIWKVVPDYERAGGRISKGEEWGESSVSLAIDLQQRLDLESSITMSPKRFTQDELKDMLKLFYTTAPHKSLRTPNERELLNRGRRLSDIALNVNDITNVNLKPEHLPDLTSKSAEWTSSTPMYGEINYRVVYSYDRTIRFMILSSGDDVWIGSAEYTSGKFATAFGVPEHAVGIGLLATPPYDYVNYSYSDEQQLHPTSLEYGFVPGLRINPVIAGIRDQLGK